LTGHIYHLILDNTLPANLSDGLLLLLLESSSKSSHLFIYLLIVSLFFKYTDFL
jgi:hypothetical protein